MKTPECTSLGVASDREQWLQMRRQGIGGSDAATVLGVSTIKSRKQLAEIKQGTRKPDPPNANTRFGHLLEEPVLQLVGEWGNLGSPKQRVVAGEDVGTLKSVKRPWQLANLDGALVQPQLQKLESVDQFGLVIGGVEIKTTDQRGLRHWNEGVPRWYLAQVYHYMAVTGWPFFKVCLFVSPVSRAEFIRVFDALSKEDAVVFAEMVARSGELHIFDVPRNEAAIEFINAAEHEFWQQLEQVRQRACG